MTVNDTFEANGIVRVLFVANKKGGDFLLMNDYFGKRAVLDAKHYASVFSSVFTVIRQPDRDVTIEFTLDGQGWHLKATPIQGVDLDAAYAAFLEALNQPD